MSSYLENLDPAKINSLLTKNLKKKRKINKSMLNNYNAGEEPLHISKMLEVARNSRRIL